MPLSGVGGPARLLTLASALKSSFFRILIAVTRIPFKYFPYILHMKAFGFEEGAISPSMFLGLVTSVVKKRSETGQRDSCHSQAILNLPLLDKVSLTRKGP